MAEVKVKCPYCRSEEISLYGKNAKGSKDIYVTTNNAKEKHLYLIIHITPVSHK